MKTVMVAFCMALAGGTAVAQSEGPRGGMGLMRADANGDGFVTRAEYTAQADARFARMDANGNGRLDADEATRGGGPRGDAPPPPSSAGAAPARAAPPIAGTTRDQFRSMTMARFDRLDVDHDGRINAIEMPARRNRGPGGDRRGPPPAPPAG